jgi:hypothetical protein
VAATGARVVMSVVRGVGVLLAHLLLMLISSLVYARLIDNRLRSLESSRVLQRVEILRRERLVERGVEAVGNMR